MKNAVRAGAVAAAVCLALAGCGGGGTGSGELQPPSASEADPNGHLRVAYTVNAMALNPHKVTSPTGAYPYLTPLYDRLTQTKDVDGTLEVAPMVATGWEFSPDGREVVFTLREDVTFSDGARLDAEAVKASLDHAIETPGSTVASTFSMIDAVEVVDPTHVRIVTNRPASDLPAVLSGVEASLISPLALDNPDLDVKPVGSGPYIATSIKIGDSVTYERREGYWDPEAQLAQTITIQGFPDDNARLNALRSGQVDLMLAKVGQYGQASNLGNGFGYFAYPVSQVYSVYLNTNRPGLDNKEFRQALNYAVDREGISTSLLNGQCVPNAQPVTPAMDGFLSDPPIEYTYDPAKARELLAKSGISDPKITILTPAGLSPQVDIAAALEAQFSDVGIDVTLKPSDPYDVNRLYSSGSEDANTTIRVQDPTSMQSLVRNYTNPHYFPGPVPSALSEALAPTYDPNIAQDELTSSLEEAVAVVTDEALDVFICGVATQFAFADNVIGVESMGISHYSGVMDLRYVGVAKK